MIAGSLTGWKYTPMFPIDQFVMMLDPDYRDPLEQLMESRGPTKCG